MHRINKRNSHNASCGEDIMLSVFTSLFNILSVIQLVSMLLFGLSVVVEAGIRRVGEGLVGGRGGGHT